MDDKKLKIAVNKGGRKTPDEEERREQGEDEGHETRHKKRKIISNDEGERRQDEETEKNEVEMRGRRQHENMTHEVEMQHSSAQRRNVRPSPAPCAHCGNSAPWWYRAPWRPTRMWGS